MGEPIKLLTANYVGNETYFGKKGEYTGNSFRVGADLLESKYGKLNVKYLFNTDTKNEVRPQCRFTAYSPDLKLGDFGDTKFKANFENWTTIKCNKMFETEDIANSARIKLKAQNGEYSAYSALKLDCSQTNPTPKFNGATVGIQKNFGKKISAYLEGYLPKESFQGKFSDTSYGIGLAMKF